MNETATYARITADTGLASEVLHVSPIFLRCGPRTRGNFAERRLARARRSEARLERRAPAQPVAALSYSARLQGW
jgi:hypothetical protein